VRDEYVEDKYDGTRMHWEGYLLDEDGRAVEIEETYEAVILPQQVLKPWLEATVDAELRRARYSAERIFPGTSW